MGLPMWRAPSPEPRQPPKLDPTAPARSPIRRRPSFAGRRARATRSPRSPRWLETDFLPSASRFAPTEPAPRPQSARDDDAPALRPPPPPVPESRNYSSFRDDDSLMRMRRERYYSSIHPSGRPNFGEFTRSPRPLPALTPNFAPAVATRSRLHRAPSQSRLRSTSPEPRPTISRGSWADLYQATRRENAAFMDALDDNSDNAVGSPPLRRMGRRGIADGPLPSSSLRESWSPAASIDGLGDRDRSVSPAEDHWDTMLTTVVQDPLAPTAESSFTSAAASASFSNSHPSSRAGSSNSNSAASSRTHLTVPSRRHSTTEQFMRACDTSDDDTASDTEEEDLETRRSFLRARRFEAPDAPPSRNPNRYSRGIRDRSRETTAYVRSYYESGAGRNNVRQTERPLGGQLDGTGDAYTNDMHDELQALDSQLRDARAVLEQLTRRDDVPDEFWASVGLSRSMADRVERLQQREQS
ncbi:hypothetical protein EJ04DRAFT_507687 [Polyplosphaeria fusca]|uniref:Uncharacterized protein n=1 Tax=Polyplosphaeria fusca TaxID=682080 RepID=A0A9P4V8U1_9PLEO|nr:hypothetical protein EJ04DRAFT_507687 [Polyplosphaeria fusca]